jgi:membrane protein involved in colicin uptake
MTSATDKVASDKAMADSKAASDKLAADKAAAPKTANEVLAKVDDDHDWNPAPEDLNTTGGIQRAVQRNRDAIAALANFIDGKR